MNLKNGLLHIKLYREKMQNLGLEFIYFNFLYIFCSNLSYNLKWKVFSYVKMIELHEFALALTTIENHASGVADVAAV